MSSRILVARGGALLAGLCLCGLSACAPNGRPAVPRQQVVGEFVGMMDAQSGTLHVRMLSGASSQSLPAGDVQALALAEVPVGTAPNTVTLSTVAGSITATNASGTGVDPTGNGSGKTTGCGRPSSYCGDVKLTSNYADSELHNVHVEITQITPAAGFLGFTNSVPPSGGGVSDTWGLWAYPALQDNSRAGNAATRTWRFDMLSAGNFTFSGRVMADVVAKVSGTNNGACPDPTPLGTTALNTATDCGECGRACPGNATCVWPQSATTPTPPCVCDTGLTFCDSGAGSFAYQDRRCVDLQSDASSCGACGNVCGSSTPKCVAGRCAAQGANRTILVIGPHPDDETLIAGGRIHDAVQKGDTVKVAVVMNAGVVCDQTNGSLTAGLEREDESVSALASLGVPRRNVIFLGHADGGGLKSCFLDAAGTTLKNGAPIAFDATHTCTPTAYQTTTYGARGLGGLDFHTYLNGSPGPYNRNTVLGDIEALLLNYRPDEVYTTSNFDRQEDHGVAGLFVNEAVRSLKASGKLTSTKLYQSIVWQPNQPVGPTATWPCQSSPLVGPPDLDAGTGLSYGVNPLDMSPTQLAWADAQLIAVPPDMASTTASNLKYQAINDYTLYVDNHLRCYARSDEFFWLTDFGGKNLAFTAAPSSSSNGWRGSAYVGPDRAVDGAISGGPTWYNRTEWVAAVVPGFNGGPQSITLTWGSPVTVAQVNLYDRPDPSENVTDGTLEFSDTSTISVGALPADGKVKVVTVSPAKVVTWVRFRIDLATGTDGTGLSEIQVLAP